ncbi:MAG: hypothetical protein IPL18_11950 [Sphingomonadales bacterium]|nr:hypothetical protein [Sphingomonadales bacterium]
MFRDLIKKLYEAVLAVLSDRQQVMLSFLKSHGSFPDIDHPKTFSHHLCKIKLEPVDKAFVAFSDKILAKENVSKIIGDAYVTPTLWHGSTLPPVHERNWPIPYVIKANHGSNQNLFIRNDSDIMWGEIDETTEQWLATEWPTWLNEKMVQPD